MANTVPARAPLGASTTNRKWYLDVEDPAAPGVPVGVFGMGEFKFKPSEATQQDDSDMDSEGFKSSTVTALAWGGEGKLHRKTLSSDGTAYDPGQEILRRASRGMGNANRVKVRVYEMEPDGPRVEAYSGYCLATWSPDGGGMDALDTVSFALVGQGKCSEIAHPEGVVAVPVIQSALPSGAVAGATVAIEGAHFADVAGASGVKFGATNATSYNVLSDGTILAVVPAGAAGSAPITVGTGEVYPYTRGA
jgi:hypothetical protein